jgi:hypothetical protein
MARFVRISLYWDGRARAEQRRYLLQLLEDEGAHDAVADHKREQPDVGEEEGGEGAGDLTKGGLSQQGGG